MRNMNLLYYRKEAEQFGDLTSNTLTDDEARYAFKRLKAHYKLQNHLELFGYRGGGNCGVFRIRLSHNPSLRVLCHELAHAIQWKKGWHTHGKKWHTKRHKSIMTRVWKYALPRLEGWKAQVKKNCDRHYQSAVNRQNKKAKTEELKRTPAYKLEHLRKLERKAESRVRRATTHLKKIQRRIRIWEKKTSPISFI